MSNPHSIVHYGIDAEQKSIDQAIAKQQWVGAANNTKWSEWITFMQNDDKSPSYRYCWMPNHFISNWDVEWFGHIPRPFAGVLWLDIGTLEEVVEKPWGHQKIIDHSDRFKELLVKIGLEFEQREDVIRIWGYLPKDETDFPPQANFKPHKIFSDTWK
ncbi:TPA: DUF6678 family protein [Acinetobacter baumannii]